MLVKQIQEEKHKTARAVFHQIDEDKTGDIDRDELTHALKESDIMSGQQDKEVTIQKILDEMDSNHDKTISYTEFLAATIDPKVLKEENILQGLFN